MFEFMEIIEFQVIQDKKCDSDFKNAIQILRSEKFLSLKINENMLQIDELFTNNKHSVELLVNMVKHKILANFASQKSNNENLVVMNFFDLENAARFLENNIGFFAKLWQQLNRDASAKSKKLNRVGNEIFEILSKFYFGQLFSTLFLKDLVAICSQLITPPPNFITQNINNVLEEFFRKNFELMISLNLAEPYKNIFEAMEVKSQNFSKVFFSIFMNKTKIK